MEKSRYARGEIKYEFDMQPVSPKIAIINISLMI